MQFLIPSITISTARLRPLLGVDAIVCWLDSSPREVIGMVESGQLAVAFDIGLGHQRAELRVWSECVICWMLEKPQPTDLARCIESVLPRCQVLRSAGLARRLACGVDHICHLVKSGQWQVLQPPARGPGGSATVSRASVAKWLEGRRVQ